MQIAGVRRLLQRVHRPGRLVRAEHGTAPAARAHRLHAALADLLNGGVVIHGAAPTSEWFRAEQSAHPTCNRTDAEQDKSAPKPARVTYGSAGVSLLLTRSHVIFTARFAVPLLPSAASWARLGLVITAGRRTEGSPRKIPVKIASDRLAQQTWAERYPSPSGH